MSNYTPTGKPQEGSRYVSKDIRDEFILIKNALNSKADFTTPTFDSQVTFDVSPLAPTPSLGDDSTKVATTAFVQAATLDGALPSQTGNSGKFFTTDGSTTSWVSVSEVPDQTSHSGKVLTTNGATASWTANYASLGANTFTGAQNTARATVAAHATTADIWGAAGNEIDFTGTATITDFPDAPQAGASRVLHIASTPTFTNNANILVQGGADYTAVSGDVATIHAITTSTFKLIPPASGISGYAQVIDLWGSAASTKYPVSHWEQIVNTTKSTGLSGSYLCITYSSSEALFIASASSASTNLISSSPDGLTWTTRNTTTSGKWTVGTDGSSLMMCDLTPSTTIKLPSSGDWTASGTALPSNPGLDPRNAPVSTGSGVFLICGGTGQIYRTTNTGTSWTTETYPGSGPGALFWLPNAGLLWGYDATTNAYTSATGTTGSWTARTLPETPISSTFFWQSGNYLLYRSSSNKIYITEDAVNWTDTGITNNTLHPIWRINDVYGLINTSNSFNVYNGVRISRGNSTIVADNQTMRPANNGSGTWVISKSTASDVIVIGNGSDTAAFI